MKNKCHNFFYCRVENIMRKGEIACYKKFLLFLQCFPLLYNFSAALCGNGLSLVLIGNSFSRQCSTATTSSIVSLDHTESFFFSLEKEF